MSWGYGTAELDFSRVMRTEDHVDHDDGHNEQDDGDDNGRDDDDNTTINCWRRFGGEDSRERDELGVWNDGGGSRRRQFGGVF